MVRLSRRCVPRAAPTACLPESLNGVGNSLTPSLLLELLEGTARKETWASPRDPARASASWSARLRPSDGARMLGGDFVRFAEAVARLHQDANAYCSAARPGSPALALGHVAGTEVERAARRHFRQINPTASLGEQRCGVLFDQSDFDDAGQGLAVDDGCSAGFPRSRGQPGTASGSCLFAAPRAGYRRTGLPAGSSYPPRPAGSLVRANPAGR